MKQKRILLAVLMVVLITALTGCKKDKDSKFTIGAWNENVFENAWLNMKIEIPTDWSIATDEEISELMDAGIDMTDLKGSGNDLLKKVAEIKNIYGFMVYSPDSTTNLQLIYENLALSLGGTKYTEKDYIDTVSDMLLNNASIDYTVEEQRTVQIAGEDFELLRLSLLDGAYYQDFYCHKVDKYMVSLVASYKQENQTSIDDMIAKITALE